MIGCRFDRTRRFSSPVCSLHSRLVRQCRIHQLAVPPLAASICPTLPMRSFGKFVVSLALVYHLAAIVAGPSSIAPSSQVQRDSFLAFGPYLEALYLNHGWHFFAPDPGPSTLVGYEAKTASGETITGRIPDKQQMQPRLLYHRHFMLTEALPRMRDADPKVLADYEQALANGVGLMTDVQTVELEQLTHRLPTMQAIRAGFPVSDPALFDEVPLGSFSCPE